MNLTSTASTAKYVFVLEIFTDIFGFTEHLEQNSWVTQSFFKLNTFTLFKNPLYGVIFQSQN